MFGVHLIPTHWDTTREIERFKQWNPAWFKIVTVDSKVPHLDDLFKNFPKAKFIVRNHPLSELYGNRGLPTTTVAVETGIAAVNSHIETANWLEASGYPLGQFWFEGLNEPHCYDDHPLADEPSVHVCTYERTRITRMHDVGLKAVAFNFGVGWPGNHGIKDAPPDWSPFKPAIDAMWPSDFIGVHEYWGLSTPSQNWRWWGGRLLQCPYDKPILVTECGIDTGVTGQFFGAWRDLPMETYDAKAHQYVWELFWYAQQLIAQDTKGRVKQVFPFTYDIGGKEWEKFDIQDEVWFREFMERVSAQGMPTPANVVTPPPPSVEPVNPADPTVRSIVRNAGWNNVGVAYNPVSAFTIYAAKNNMGRPIRDEHDVMIGNQPWRQQEFENGIVYAPVGQWNLTTHVLWF